MGEHSHFIYFIMKLDSLNWYKCVCGRGPDMHNRQGLGWEGTQSIRALVHTLFDGTPQKATTSKHDSVIRSSCV